MGKQERRRKASLQRPQAPDVSTQRPSPHTAEYRQVFLGEGNVPITEAIIRMLVHEKGWPEDKVREAQRAGATYCVPRGTIIMPPRFESVKEDG